MYAIRMITTWRLLLVLAENKRHDYEKHISTRTFFFTIISNEKIVHMYMSEKNVFFNRSKNNSSLLFDAEWKRTRNERLVSMHRKKKKSIYNRRSWLIVQGWLTKTCTIIVIIFLDRNFSERQKHKIRWLSSYHLHSIPFLTRSKINLPTERDSRKRKEEAYWQSTSDETNRRYYRISFLSNLLFLEMNTSLNLSSAPVIFVSLAFMYPVAAFLFTYHMKHLSWQRRDKPIACRIISERSFFYIISDVRQIKKSLFIHVRSEINLRKWKSSCI